MTNLLNKKCVPCEGGVEPLAKAKAGEYLKLIPGWKIAGADKVINRSLAFNDFTAAIKFINQLAELAESESHHPNFTLHDWNQVDIELSTHAIGGLSENDFILAAKINQLLSFNNSQPKP